MARLGVATARRECRLLSITAASNSLSLSPDLRGEEKARAFAAG
jgi:hypothetical protein